MILCIDPGSSGGIAVQDGNHVTAMPMPKTQGDILLLIKAHTLDFEELGASFVRVAYLEQVGGFCGENQPGSAMFKFGEGYGFLKGVLQALEWRLELIRPQEWQKGLSLGTKAAAGGKLPWKRKLKETAQRLYPGLIVTLSTADALLMLHYTNRRPTS